ncbi:MAG: alpha/beta fold hydrolase [Planctomycetes bacterium]|nr:alpha/beta fold hydrolase [Planctomycetota bacterium]
MALPATTGFIYFHGFASGPGSRKAQAFRSAFADAGWPLEIPDLNPPEFRKMTLGSMVASAEALALERGGPFVLLGSSLGGYLAALLASRLPNVRAVVVMAPAFDIRARWREQLGDEALETWKTSGSMPVFHHGYQEERLLDYGFFEEAAAHPPYPDVGETPVLIFHGRRDAVVPLEVAETFARAHPLARLRVLEDDHALQESIPAVVTEAMAFVGSALARPLGEEISRG